MLKAWVGSSVQQRSNHIDIIPCHGHFEWKVAILGKTFRLSPVFQKHLQLRELFVDNSLVKSAAGTMVARIDIGT
jgi:hypothetical protein